MVWAQEHLYRAVGPITIDGSFGPETQSAVESVRATATRDNLILPPPASARDRAKGYQIPPNLDAG